METNYSDMGKRYKMAYDKVWNTLSQYEKEEVLKDKNSRYAIDFVKKVTDIAEDFNIILIENKILKTETKLLNVS